MSLHDDLLGQARQLAVKEPKRPLQASLRRAVSTSYYGLFHLLVHDATGRMFPGRERAALRNCMARAFVHGDMKRVAQQFSNDNVSPKLAPGLNGQPLQPELIGVATAFVDLQQARHEADYDNSASIHAPGGSRLAGAGGTGVCELASGAKEYPGGHLLGRVARIREHANLSVWRERTPEPSMRAIHHL